MLNQAKVMHALNEVRSKLFIDLSTEINLARTAWQHAVADTLLLPKLLRVSSDLLIPLWQGKLDETFKIDKVPLKYCVASVDGSQIYPDRHQGTSCFLINIGSVQLHYGTTQKGATLDSQPYVYAEHDGDFDATTDLVNCRRQELELDAGFTLSQKVKAENEDLPLAFLFDGSLIFWHLQAKDPEVKNHFLDRYIAKLEQFYQQQLLMAGYISLPKSKELVNILRLVLCNFNLTDCPQADKLDHIVDTSIVKFFVQPHHYTGVFANRSPITQYYPDHLKPYFLYADFGHEIGRIEMPAWIATNQELVEQVVAILYDQSIKGYGYPIALAEAHEQAVVKGPDRDFFYHIVQKLGMEERKTISISQKSSKKRRIGV
jgi:NurA domain